MIDGSPHADGMTARLTAVFLEALPPGIAVERFSCFARQPLACDDCRFCHRQDGCSKRDLDDFYRQLEEAELLLFASPVYNRSFPAPMKALIDRLQRYWAARFVRGVRPPIPRPKRAALLTVSGGPHPEGTYLEQQLRPALTVLHATLEATVHVGGTDTDGLSETAAAEARAAAGLWK